MMLQHLNEICPSWDILLLEEGFERSTEGRPDIQATNEVPRALEEAAVKKGALCQ